MPTLRLQTSQFVNGENTSCSFLPENDHCGPGQTLRNQPRKLVTQVGLMKTSSYLFLFPVVDCFAPNLRDAIFRHDSRDRPEAFSI